MFAHVRLLVVALAALGATASADEPRTLMESGPAGVAVDEALERRSSRPLLKLVDRAVRKKLDQAIRDLGELSEHADDDLATARLQLQGYAALVRYVERILEVAENPLTEAAGAGADQVCICTCPPCRPKGECPPCLCLCTGLAEQCPVNDERDERDEREPILLRR